MVDASFESLVQGICPPRRVGPPDVGDVEIDRVAARLRASNVPVVEWTVDPT
jgi:hypothetical protein